MMVVVKVTARLKCGAESETAGRVRRKGQSDRRVDSWDAGHAIEHDDETVVSR